MAEREIKIRAFTWQERVESVSGVVGSVRRVVRRGDVVDLPDDAIKRGEALDAFVTDEDRQPKTTEEGLAVAEMDDDELTNWVSESTIPQILSAANDDREMANRLLQAENDATGNDPRAGLVQGLSKIAGETD